MTLLESQSISDTEINDMINAVMNEIGVAARWPFLQTSTTISTTAATQTYALPADFNYGSHVTDADNDSPLEVLSADQGWHLYGDGTGTTATTATSFWLWGTNIYLYPVPSAIDANRYTLWYYKTVTELATDGASPEWDAGFHWMVVDGVKAKLWEREEYFEQAERSRLNYTRQLNMMIQFYINQFRQYPVIYGDGRRQRLTNANMPFLDTGV